MKIELMFSAYLTNKNDYIQFEKELNEEEIDLEEVQELGYRLGWAKIDQKESLENIIKEAEQQPRKLMKKYSIEDCEIFEPDFIITEIVFDSYYRIPVAIEFKWNNVEKIFNFIKSELHYEIGPISLWGHD